MFRAAVAYVVPWLLIMHPIAAVAGELQRLLSSSSASLAALVLG